MATPTNVFYLIDDYSSSNLGAVGGGVAVTHEFTAPSLANAQSVAQIWATLFQKPCRLVQKYGASPPWTPVFAPSASMALSNAPSSISY